MEVSDVIGWAAGVILLLTVGRQVYTQWKSGKSAGVSKWLFVGQIAASTGFVIYSLMLENWVFVVTNAFMLITAIIGQVLFLRSKANAPSGANTAAAAEG
jgi:MtN3 and saliva related transmembrane protein